ncbi:MAG TPA: tetratricopeptide repeat protein [Methylophilaceae bacterium]|jgi:predicted O-linked N-acetylglucosamine transferase (SPINDLY family)
MNKEQKNQLMIAVNHYQTLINKAPRDWEAHFNLGAVYLELNRFEEAAGCFRKVFHANPKNPDVKNALGYALQSLGTECQQAGHYVQAEACFQEIIPLSPSDAMLYYNLGNAQRELGKSQQALISYQQAARLMPNDADIHNNLGNVYRELGRLDEAIKSYQAAITLNPRLFHAQVHLVHQKQHICDWSDLDKDIDQIRAWVHAEPSAQISPFALIAMPDTQLSEQKKCADNWLSNRYNKLINNEKFNFKNRNHQKIRIGYLSADFRLHPLASLIGELMELHDKSQFETYAYSYGADDKTPERKRLEQAFDHFTDIRPQSLSESAQCIYADEIDILVDLTGFTQTSRTGIVALNPAPISVSWLGFPGTMGSLNSKPLFDYLLTDSNITPLTHSAYYAENLAFLPNSYQPNDRKRPVGKTPSRSDYNLADDAFVFCCFNQTYKITPNMFDVWMRLLAKVPNSILWLLDCNPLARENLKREAETRNIDSQRLIFAPRTNMADHLARHTLADLFLDTLPYNAHTTTSDALWMGLPVLTCQGETFAGRVATSLLNAVNLPELVTLNIEDYEARALQIATNPQALNTIKDKLVRTKHTAPLFDTNLFAHNLEAIYQEMWRIYLSNQPPRSIVM